MKKLQDLLENYNVDSVISLKNYLKSYPYIKYTENKDVLVLTRDKSMSNLTKIEYNCYFTIINKNPFRIITSYKDYNYFNTDCINFLCKYKLLSYDLKIYEEFDGELYSFFYLKGNWNIVSLNNLETEINMDIINTGVEINKLIKSLNKNHIYYFQLINKNLNSIVDYTYRFGDDYSCLFHISTKLDNVYIDISDKPFFDLGVKYKEELKDYSLLDSNNTKNLFPLVKGLSVNVYINSLYYTFTIDTNDYRYSKSLCPDVKNKYKSFIRLYKDGLLKDHILKYNNSMYIENSRVPYNKYETYRVINNSFKLLAFELFELFKLVWDINDTSHLDSNLYNFLPTEYKVLLYRVKGIYFQNRQDNKLSSLNEYLEVSNIFDYLKIIDNNLILKLFLARRKIKYILEKKQTTQSINRTFKNILLKIDKTDLKMFAILTNYLYPEIKRVEV